MAIAGSPKRVSHNGTIKQTLPVVGLTAVKT